MDPRADAILNSLPGAVLYTDGQARILECNRLACEWFGYPHDELLGRSLTGMMSIPPAGMESVDDVPPLWLHKGGETFRAEVTCHRVADETGLLWLLTDPAEGEAARADSNRLLLENRESERLRLARELHDGVIQDMIAIGFGLAALEPGSSAQHEAIKRQRAAALGVVQQLRSIVRELRPAGLEEFGLQTCLEGLVAKLTADHAGPVPRLELAVESLPGLSLPVELCLYRTAQEAVTNSLRHARASRISVRLQKVGDLTELCVEDDGCGFEFSGHLSALTSAQHYGLAGLVERAQLVGGSVSIDSVPGRGTKVRLTIPTSGP